MTDFLMIEVDARLGRSCELVGANTPSNHFVSVINRLLCGLEFKVVRSSQLCEIALLELPIYYLW